MLRDRTFGDGTPILVPGIVPRLTEAPGTMLQLGAVALGAGNDAVHGGILRLDPHERARLREAGNI